MAVSGMLDLYSKSTGLVFQEEVISFSPCKNFESYKIQVTIYAYNATVTKQLQAECFHVQMYNTTYSAINEGIRIINSDLYYK